MKKKYSSYFVVILASIVVTAGAYAILHKGDIIVAHVNGKPIYASDIEEKIKEIKEAKMIEDNGQEFDFKSMDKSMKESLIRNFIVADLIESEAKDNKVDQDPAFQKMLKLSKQQLIQKFFIDKKVNEYITEQKIKESYEKYIKEHAQKEEFKVKQILASSEEEINKIKQELANKDANFEEIAKKYGTNQEKDELGYLPSGQMPQEVENVVKGLQLSQISEPFKTDFGWHIIKLIDKRKATMPSFDELKYELRDKLVQEYVKSLVFELLDKNKVKISLE